MRYEVAKDLWALGAAAFRCRHPSAKNYRSFWKVAALKKNPNEPHIAITTFVRLTLMIDNTHLISSSELQDSQHVDARGSTFNDVKRDQHNVQITINNTYAPSDNVADTPVCPPRSLVHFLDFDPFDSGGSKYRRGAEQVPTSAHVRFGCCGECHKIRHDKHRGCRHTLGTPCLVGFRHGHLEITYRH
jgi:hypothetical protein